MNVTVVVNRRSRAGLATWQRLQAKRAELAQHTRLWLDEWPEPYELGRQLANTAQRLLVIGGDGSLHCVLNALASAQALNTIEVALIPAGTGSDFAKSLPGLPRALEARLDFALEAPAHPTGLIQVRLDDDLRYAVNIASAGLSGQVAAQVNRQPKRSASSYLRASVQGFFRYRPRPFRYLGPSQHRECPLLFFVAANGQFFGNGMHIAPRADITSHQLQLLAIRPVPGWQLPWRFAQLYAGRHLNAPCTEHWHSERAELTAQGQPMALELDGESYRAHRAEFKKCPSAWRLVH